MKALEEMTPEEIMALARQQQEANAILEQEKAEAAELIEKLKGEVLEKKDVAAPITSVKFDNKTYVFPTEQWTEPNYEGGDEPKTMTAKEAVKDKSLIKKLIDRKFLVEKK